MPALRVRKQHAAILREHFKTMDLESQRCGSPLADGSFFGLSEKVLAIRTGIGDPRQKTKWGWKGRSTLQARVRELRYAGLLHWGRGDLIKGGKACNPRGLITKGPRKGEYHLYPSVRRVSTWV